MKVNLDNTKEKKNVLEETQLKAGRDVQIGDTNFNITLYFNLKIVAILVLLSAITYLGINHIKQPSPNENLTKSNQENLIDTISTKPNNSTNKKEQSAITKSTPLPIDPPKKLNNKKRFIQIKHPNIAPLLQSTVFIALNDLFKPYDLQVINANSNTTTDLEMTYELMVSIEKISTLGHPANSLVFQFTMKLSDTDKKVIIHSFAKKSKPLFLPSNENHNEPLAQWLNSLDPLSGLSSDHLIQ